MSHLKCTSCGSQSPRHSEVCPNTPASRLAEEMAEMHSEYSDSSSGKNPLTFSSRSANSEMKEYMCANKRLWALKLINTLSLSPSPPHCLSIPSHFFFSFSLFIPPVENGTYFCNECDSKFAEEEALKRHMLQVHSDKPYKCDRCQAAFRYKGNLASHKTVHTGENQNKPALLHCNYMYICL